MLIFSSSHFNLFIVQIVHADNCTVSHFFSVNFVEAVYRIFWKHHISPKWNFWVKIADRFCKWFTRVHCWWEMKRKNNGYYVLVHVVATSKMPHGIAYHILVLNFAGFNVMHVLYSCCCTIIKIVSTICCTYTVKSIRSTYFLQRWQTLQRNLFYFLDLPVQHVTDAFSKWPWWPSY